MTTTLTTSLHLRRTTTLVGTIILAALAACSGSNGSDGSVGANGQNGTDGKVGNNGTSGKDGTAGKDGAAGTPGSAGSAGPTGPSGPPGSGKSLSFQPVAVPVTTIDKAALVATRRATVNGTDVALDYQIEVRSGDTSASNVFGRILAKDKTVVKNADGTELVSNYNDFSSLLSVSGKLFEVTHIETLPGGMYLSDVTQSATGALTVSNSRPIDFSSVNGTWNPCAGFVSPWGTHLGSEEYPGDARAFETGADVVTAVGAFNTNVVRYFGLDPATATLAQMKAVYNPYFYGWVTEVSVDAGGVPTVKKHYAAGRRALELAHVMPDQKTVYLSDDGTNDAFYMFIAKTPGDLSEGTLYAARWFQTSPAGAPNGRADLFWIKLGPSAKDSEVKALLDAGTKFSDIFDAKTQDTDGSCTTAGAGYKAINADTGRECLLLKTGMELAASRFESRRYAAYVGATTEFRKTEGLTFDPQTSRLFVSFSEINGGMLDNNASRDLGGPNHIKLAQNYCGAVYELVLGKNPLIGSDYVAESAAALVEGMPLDPLGGKAGSYPTDSPYYDATATAEGGAAAKTNVCGLSGIANPDNITFVTGYGTLIIGEDTTDGHQNDALWAYDLQRRELTRILTSPYGAEVTGAYWYPNLGGHGYLKVQIQHPYVESDPEKAPSAAARASYVGYIGPFPKMD